MYPSHSGLRRLRVTLERLQGSKDDGVFETDRVALQNGSQEPRPDPHRGNHSQKTDAKAARLRLRKGRVPKP